MGKEKTTGITDLSKEYLHKFLTFARKALGYEPIIVGGWAVFALTKAEQSVDVDILLNSENDIPKLEPFFKKHCFKKEQDFKGNANFELLLEEPDEIGGIKIESLVFDIMTKNEKNKLHENENIQVPWALAFDHNISIDFEGKKIVIPSPEVLIIFKAKALCDRTFDKYKFLEHMRHKKAFAAKKDFKIEKDKRDIKSLVNTGKIDVEKLEKILKKIKFKEIYERTTEGLIKK